MNSLDPVKTLNSLQSIFAIRKKIPSWSFLSEEKKEKISVLQDIIENMNYSVVLDYLFVNDLERLLRIHQRVKKNTEFSGYIELLAGICRDETDFDFLTEPEKCVFYDRLFSLAEKTGKQIPRYVNVLKKICDNKNLGIYQEGQEIRFFLDEYIQKEKSVSDIDFVRMFKKVLNIKSQKIFERLFEDNIFDEAVQIFKTYKSKITDETTLGFFIYGHIYYKKLDLSNENEEIFLNHLASLIDIMTKQKPFPFEIHKKDNPECFEERIKDFFKKENPKNPKKLIALLKDYSLNDTEIVDFCEKLKDTFYGKKITFEFTDSINIIAETVSNYTYKSSFKWLDVIFRTQLNTIITDNDIKIFSTVFEGLTINHFFEKRKDFRINKDIKFLEQNRKQIKKCYDIICNLVKNDVLGKILFINYREKHEPHIAAEFIADNYFHSCFNENSERERYICLIELFYSIFVKKFDFYFDVGDAVRVKNSDIGGIIKEILRISGYWYYKIKCGNHHYDVRVSEVYRHSISFRGKIIREQQFIYKEELFIVNEYSVNENLYRNIIYAFQDEEVLNKRSLVLQFLESNGINVSTKKINTYNAIGMLLDFLEKK